MTKNYQLVDAYKKYSSHTLDSFKRDFHKKSLNRFKGHCLESLVSLVAHGIGLDGYQANVKLQYGDMDGYWNNIDFEMKNWHDGGFKNTESHKKIASILRKKDGYEIKRIILIATDSVKPSEAWLKQNHVSLINVGDQVFLPSFSEFANAYRHIEDGLRKLVYKAHTSNRIVNRYSMLFNVYSLVNFVAWLLSMAFRHDRGRSLGLFGCEFDYEKVLKI